MKELTVAAAIIKNNDGKILICQRADNTSMGGFWEFPGGKLEPHETAEECIERECREELSVDISVKSIFAVTRYRYPDKLINFTFFNAVIINGDIKMNVHKNLKWENVCKLKGYEFCPADIAVIDKILNSDEYR